MGHLSEHEYSYPGSSPREARAHAALAAVKAEVAAATPSMAELWATNTALVAAEAAYDAAWRVVPIAREVWHVAARAVAATLEASLNARGLSDRARNAIRWRIIDLRGNRGPTDDHPELQAQYAAYDAARQASIAAQAARNAAEKAARDAALPAELLARLAAAEAEVAAARVAAYAPNACGDDARTTSP